MSAALEPVDRAILDWIAVNTDDDALREQLKNAAVKKRDVVRTGFFVYFETPAGAQAGATVRPVCPHLDAPGLMDGAGCELFLRDGRLHYMEVYARGGFLPEPLEDYQLGPARD